MNKQELGMLGFEIVAYSGDARSTLLSLIREMRGGSFEHVDEALKDADENLKLAHNAQTKVLAEEASGTDLELGFIFIHGQDHLMTTMLLRDIAEDFVELYKANYQK